MIETLYIKNYLIIKESEIEFKKGLNILTGETGAGKSIIIDALSMILGERADYSKIKKDEDKLIVEAHFNFKRNPVLSALLKEMLNEDYAETDNVILRRELNKKGTSRNFINDSPVNISDMKKLGDLIIDIHSQNEHQSLLNKDTHLELLDNYCSSEKLLNKYYDDFGELREMINNYKNLQFKKDELISKRKFLEYELKEINNLSLNEGEDEDLEIELKKLENVEYISNSLNVCLGLLTENENSTVNTLSIAIKELKKIIGFDKEIERISEEIENSFIIIKENSDSLFKYRDELNFDSQRIEQIRNRLSDINHLRKKYGMNLSELISKGDSLQRELIFAENFDYELEQLFNSISDKREIVFKEALELSALRKKKSIELQKNINNIFKETGLENGEFKVGIENISGSEDDLFSVKKDKEIFKLGSKGLDEIEFLIKMNKGSDFSSLRKSASGGEVSRIMLAIKTVLSEKDNIGILVFDEIDAGISGRIAQKVGKILKSLSKTHQIICITHLPQIAAMSDRHFHVSKSGNNTGTTAEIKLLNDEEKVMEVAKLVSGEKVTDTSMKSASELINS